MNAEKESSLTGSLVKKNLRRRASDGRVLREDNVPPCLRDLRAARNIARATSTLRYEHKKNMGRSGPNKGQRGRSKKCIVPFKINGQSREEAAEYHTALLKFIADEKLLDESSDDFSESSDDLQAEKRMKKVKMKRQPDCEERGGPGEKSAEKCAPKKRKERRESSDKSLVDTPKLTKKQGYKFPVGKGVVTKRKEERSEKKGPRGELFSRKRKKRERSKTDECSLRKRQNEKMDGKLIKIKWTENVRKKKTKPFGSKVKLEGDKKSLDLDCRVVLTPLPSSVIVEKLNPRSSPTFARGEGLQFPGTVSVGKDLPSECLDDEDYVLDGENLLAFFSCLDPVEPYTSGHPSESSDEDIPPPRLSPGFWESSDEDIPPPILLPYYSKSASGTRDGIHEDTSTPRLSTRCIQQNSSPEKKSAVPVPDEAQNGILLPIEDSEEPVAASGRRSNFVEPLCIDWKYSSIPSTVQPAALSDNQDTVVSAVNKMWDMKSQPSSSLQDSLVACEVPSAELPGGINVALKVSASRASLQRPLFSKRKEDYLKIEVRLKK